MNQPGVYDPDLRCPDGSDTVSCLAGSYATTPDGETIEHTDHTDLHYWRETKENGVWGTFTEVPVPHSGCGYEVDRSAYSNLNDDDAICQAWCQDFITQQDPYPNDDQRINHHNCDTFYAGSLCYAAVTPPVVGPFNKTLTLGATLETTTGYVNTLFNGEISYSTYACSAGTTSCPILIHDLAFTMAQSVTGQWPTAAANVTFSSSNLSLSLERPTSGLYSVADDTFLLPAAQVPIHVAGTAVLGTGSTAQPIDLDVHNPTDIQGIIESDGSVMMFGEFEVAPGFSLYFGDPTPQ
ncbi:hypothetical protein KEG38_17750 [Polyangium jinanense]|nr:hypothetical protein [Polyangium jinanense]MDC3955713.1 hypothetical protein [Polyangium jinanense]